MFELNKDTANCVHIRISRKAPAIKLLSISYKKPGNKIKNRVSILEWVWKKDVLLKSCLRGLIDTDGSVYRLKPHWPNLTQIFFKNNNDRLLKEVRRAFKNLGFHPSKVFGNRIVLTRQDEIGRYLDLVGTNNDTHLAEYSAFLKIKSQ